MTRKKVDSSAIKSVGYNEKQKILDVEILHSGRIYRYYGVPPEEFAAFINAPSLGYYYNTEIKPGYPDFEEVNK